MQGVGRGLESRTRHCPSPRPPCRPSHCTNLTHFRLCRTHQGMPAPPSCVASRSRAPGQGSLHKCIFCIKGIGSFQPWHALILLQPAKPLLWDWVPLGGSRPYPGPSELQSENTVPARGHREVPVSLTFLQCNTFCNVCLFPSSLKFYTTPLSAIIC